MEAGANLQQAGDAATGLDAAGGGGGDAAEELQQGALAGTVLTDNADNIALLDLEVDVLQGPDVLTAALLRAVVGLANLQVGVLPTKDIHRPPPVQVVGDGAGGHQAQAVLLADVFKNYSGHKTKISFLYENVNENEKQLLVVRKRRTTFGCTKTKNNFWLYENVNENENILTKQTIFL